MEIQRYDILDDISTFYIQVNNFPQGIDEAFETLSNLTDGFKGRKVYGVSEMQDGKMVYRACVTAQHPGEGDKYQLRSFTIPKGKYISTALKNWREHLGEINSIFGQLMQQPGVKEQSIVVEYYKNEDEAVLMLQIA